MNTKLLIPLFIIPVFIAFLNFGGCVQGNQTSNFKIKKNLCDTIESNVQTDLNAVAFFDPHNGIAVGDSGTVIITSNAGFKWRQISLFTTRDLYGVGIVDSQIAVAVGDSGTILRTTDKGITWDTSAHVNFLQALRTVAFYSTADGYAAGDSGVVFKTTDAGTTWTEVYRSWPKILNSISYNSKDSLFIVGNNGIILKGQNFIDTTLTIKNLKSIHFALKSGYFDNHSDTGFIVGETGTIFKSTNGGINWQLETDTSLGTENLRGVFLTNPHWGYAVGENGTVLRYNGKKWVLLPKATTRHLNGVDPNPWQVTSTCVGEDGEILEYNPTAVPGGVVTTFTPASSDCQNWDFTLNMSTLDFEDEAGNPVIISTLSVSSSLILPDMLGSGWVVNDEFHHEAYQTLHTTAAPPYSFSYADYSLLEPVPSGEQLILTCCLKDNSGNPWLVNSIICPYP